MKHYQNKNSSNYKKHLRPQDDLLTRLRNYVGQIKSTTIVQQIHDNRKLEVNNKIVPQLQNKFDCYTTKTHHQRVEYQNQSKNKYYQSNPISYVQSRRGINNFQQKYKTKKNQQTKIDILYTEDQTTQNSKMSQLQNSNRIENFISKVYQEKQQSKNLHNLDNFSKRQSKNIDLSMKSRQQRMMEYEQNLTNQNNKNNTKLKKPFIMKQSISRDSERKTENNRKQKDFNKRQPLIIYGSQNKNKRISEQARKNIQARKLFISDQNEQIYQNQPLYNERKEKIQSHQYKYLKFDRPYGLIRDKQNVHITNNKQQMKEHKKIIPYIIKQSQQIKFQTKELEINSKILEDKIIPLNKTENLMRSNKQQKKSEISENGTVKQMIKTEKLRKISIMNQEINNRIKNIVNQFQGYLKICQQQNP